MSYDATLVDEIVSSYLSHDPTVENSQRIVREISQKKKLGVAKVRGILVRKGVYVAQPKARNFVEAVDAPGILSAFAEFTAEDDGTYRFEGQRYSFVDKLRQTTGYTAPALEAFAREHEVWPLSRSEVDRENKWRDDRQQQEVDAQRIYGKSSVGARARSGPDGCGWAVIIVLALALVTCIETADPDEGKSDLQIKCENTLGEVGFDCG